MDITSERLATALGEAFSALDDYATDNRIVPGHSDPSVMAGAVILTAIVPVTKLEASPVPPQQEHRIAVPSVIKHQASASLVGSTRLQRRVPPAHEN